MVFLIRFEPHNIYKDMKEIVETSRRFQETVQANLGLSFIEKKYVKLISTLSQVQYYLFSSYNDRSNYTPYRMLSSP